MTSVLLRSRGRGVTGSSAVAILSLAATAAMITGYPLLSPLAWAAVLIAAAIGCAVSSRPVRDTARSTRAGVAHLAVEPFAMALMVILDLFHTHAAPVTEAAGSGHHSHLGWLTAVLGVAVAASAVVCPVLAVRHARTVGLARGTLPVLAAAAMSVMAAAMLLPS
ncbi:hypothetical protein IT072_01000 [Leifsonia sp. ZF2019]|uniref:hypothetical protein n=1 Tax=Leifsonia sp. ZF2019 TaxID=2781978 RepID=UPI001CBF49AD|nr:hypothetical protein [Leifsonia sp. ZF2019]UAJ79710.1 hypothetical protein IT072_01000 [Leifsonia sp. ZF2019]